MHIILQCCILVLITHSLICDSNFINKSSDDAISRYKVNSLSTKAAYSYVYQDQSTKYAHTGPTYLRPVPYDRNCTEDLDCSKIDENMICFEEICRCRQGFIYIYNSHQSCFKKANIFEKCIYSYQCSSFMANTLCRDGKCICAFSYQYNGVMCINRNAQRSKANEVYTAALVAVSCIMVAVTCILVGCVVKKSSQLRNYQHRTARNGQINDVFTIADEMAVARTVDKPPTYDEVMRNEERQCGIPPPDYPVSSIVTEESVSSSPGPSHLQSPIILGIQNHTETTNTETCLLASSPQFQTSAVISEITPVHTVHATSDITIDINNTNCDSEDSRTNEEDSKDCYEVYSNPAFVSDA